MKSDNWPLRAKHILKTELKRRRINYSDLADKLAAIGIEENEKNLAKKISRGSFKAAFLFQCLAAIGCESFHLIGGEEPLSALWVPSGNSTHPAFEWQAERKTRRGFHGAV
jgi:hypothetical protein